MGWLDVGAGATKGLEQILAENLAKEQFDRRQAETERSNRADEGFRGQQLDQQGEDLRLRGVERGQARTEKAATDALVEQDRVRDDLARNIDQMPAGTEMSPVTWRSALSTGAATPDRFDTTAPQIPQDFTGPIQASEPQRGEPSHILKNTSRQEQMATDAQNASETRNTATIVAADERGQRAIDAADARARNNKDTPGAIRTIKSVNDKGENVDRIVDSRGNIIYEAPSQLSAGGKKETATLGELAVTLRDMKKLGDAIGWKGVGGFGEGTIRGLVKKNTGIGNNDEDVLRSLVGSIAADIGHEKYGSAFTATEKAMMSNFAPSANMHPEAIKNRIGVLLYMTETRLGQFNKGIPTTPITSQTLAELEARLGRGETLPSADAGAPGAPPPTTRGDGGGAPTGTQKPTAADLIRKYGGGAP